MNKASVRKVWLRMFYIYFKTSWRFSENKFNEHSLIYLHLHVFNGGIKSLVNKTVMEKMYLNA